MFSRIETMGDAIYTELALTHDALVPESVSVWDTNPLPQLDREGYRSGFDYVKPFLVTEAARTVSNPFYRVEASNPDTFGIGLEDKLIGSDITQDPVRAPYAVTEVFGNYGNDIISSLRKLRGEDWAARAMAITKSGNMAAHGPQALEDRAIIADLNLVYVGLLHKLNANLTPDADIFRKRLYAETDKYKKLHEMLTYNELQRKATVPKIDPGTSYAKVPVAQALDTLEPSKKTGWLFLRNTVKMLTDPKVRHAIASAVI